MAAFLGLTGCIASAAAQQNQQATETNRVFASPAQLQRCEQEHGQNVEARDRCIIEIVSANALDWQRRFSPLARGGDRGHAAFFGAMLACGMSDVDVARVDAAVPRSIAPDTLKAGIAAGRAAFADAPEGACAFLRGTVSRVLAQVGSAAQKPRTKR